MPDLSAIVLSHNTRDLLRRCLDDLAAVAAFDAVDLEIIVVDNASTDGTRAMLAERADVRVLENADNVGFAAANNQALRCVRAPFALLLNSDAFVRPGVLRSAVATLRQRPAVGMVGVRLLNVDGTVQAEHGKFPTIWTDIRVSAGADRIARPNPGGIAGSGPADWVQGACMFVRMAAAAEVGGLDARFFMYSEEVEWCRRFWDRGWQVWYLHEATVTHVGGASSTGMDLSRRAALYRSRLGLRRLLGGPLASVALWCCMVGGLGARIVVRGAAQRIAGRRVGWQTPRADWELLCRVARMDPLARWSSS